MHGRNPTLPEPPNRPPYFTVKVDGVTYTLRAPSAAKVGTLLQRLPEAQRWQLLTLPEMLTSGHSLFHIITQVPDALPHVAAVLGICWADPSWGFDTPPWTEGSLTAYGEAICEELHEQGWTLEQIADAVMGVAAVVMQQSTLSQEVLDKTAFFRLPRGKTNESESESSADSSAATTDGGSTN